MNFQVILGFALGAAVALGAWRARALSSSGAWAAALIGGLVFGLGGPPWAVLLLAFFISSSLLSRAFGRRKTVFNEKFSKGSQRDWSQVMANGGLGAGLVVLAFLLRDQAWPWIAYVGAMAAVNADTWATELGVLSSSAPRSIRTGQVVERGTSGGVSLQGTLAAAAGAALIGAAASLFTPPAAALALIGAGTAGGLAGSFFDSWLGASVQAIYICPACAKETERHPLHTCGTATLPLRGWRWMDNQVVNFLCSLVGALVGVGVWQVVA